MRLPFFLALAFCAAIPAQAVVTATAAELSANNYTITFQNSGSDFAVSRGNDFLDFNAPGFASVFAGSSVANDGTGLNWSLNSAASSTIGQQFFLDGAGGTTWASGTSVQFAVPTTSAITQLEWQALFELATGSNGTANITAVPEPESTAIVLGALACLALIRRRAGTADSH